MASSEVLGPDQFSIHHELLCQGRPSEPPYPVNASIHFSGQEGLFACGLRHFFEAPSSGGPLFRKVGVFVWSTEDEANIFYDFVAEQRLHAVDIVRAETRLMTYEEREGILWSRKDTIVITAQPNIIHVPVQTTVVMSPARALLVLDALALGAPDLRVLWPLGLEDPNLLQRARQLFPRLDVRNCPRSATNRLTMIVRH